MTTLITKILSLSVTILTMRNNSAAKSVCMLVIAAYYKSLLLLLQWCVIHVMEIFVINIIYAESSFKTHTEFTELLMAYIS